MYPAHPKTAADLVPLPLCDGPKLPPFQFPDSKQEIIFLEYIGQGAHSHVFKIEIQKQVYALKLFRFTYPHDWIGYRGPDDEDDNGEYLDAPGLCTAYHYMEPFNCECRAYGRLQDSGYADDMAIKCLGYVLLDEETERAMMEQFDAEDLVFDGIEEYDTGEIRAHFQQPPLRGIVKKLGCPLVKDHEVLTTPLARRMLRDTTRLHQLGIISVDIASRQYIDGKLADFSTTVTAPHPMLTPELNPGLSSRHLQMMEQARFNMCIKDFIDRDIAVSRWNKRGGGRDNPKARVHVYAFPGGFEDYMRRQQQPQPRYNLREKPHRRRGLYTFVDPSTYDWKGACDRTGRAIRKAGENGKGRPRTRLNANPPKWYYDGDEREWISCYIPTGLINVYGLYWRGHDGALFPSLLGLEMQE